VQPCSRARRITASHETAARACPPGKCARVLERRKNALALMSEPPPDPDAAFLIYRDGAAFALHMRCCDIHLKLDPNDQAVEQAIARHLSRVHGYIGSIDDEISLEALLRKLPTRPEPT
jgi:hypothetical protein